MINIFYRQIHLKVLLQQAILGTFLRTCTIYHPLNKENKHYLSRYAILYFLDSSSQKGIFFFIKCNVEGNNVRTNLNTKKITECSDQRYSFSKFFLP